MVQDYIKEMDEKVRSWAQLSPSQLTQLILGKSSQQKPLVIAVETDGQRMARELAEAKRSAQLTAQLRGPSSSGGVGGIQQTQPLLSPQQPTKIPIFQRPEEDASDYFDLTGLSRTVPTPAPQAVNIPPSSEFIPADLFHPPGTDVRGTFGIQAPHTISIREVQARKIATLEEALKRADTPYDKQAAKVAVEMARAVRTGDEPDLPYSDAARQVSKRWQNILRSFDMPGGVGSLVARQMGVGAVDEASWLTKVALPQALDIPISPVAEEDFAHYPSTTAEALQESLREHPLWQYMHGKKDPNTDEPMTIGTMYISLSDYVRDLPMIEQVVSDLIVTGGIPALGFPRTPALTRLGAITRFAEGKMARGFASSPTGRALVKELIHPTGTQELELAIRSGEWDVESLVAAMKDLDPQGFGSDKRAVKAVTDLLTENPNVSVDVATGPYHSTAMNQLGTTERNFLDIAVHNGQGPLVAKPHDEAAKAYWDSVGLGDAALITPDDLERYIYDELVDNVALKEERMQSLEALLTRMRKYKASGRITVEDLALLGGKHAEAVKDASPEQVLDYVDGLFRSARTTSVAANNNMVFLMGKAKESVAAAVERGRLSGRVGRRDPTQRSGFLSVTNITGQVIKSIHIDDVDNVQTHVNAIIESNKAGELEGQIKNITFKDDLNGQVMVDNNGRLMEWSIESPFVIWQHGVVGAVPIERVPVVLSRAELSRLSKLEQRIRSLPNVMVDAAGNLKPDQSRTITRLKALIDDISPDDVEELGTLKDKIRVYEGKEGREARNAAFEEIADAVEDLRIPQLEELVSVADVDPRRLPGIGKPKVPAWYPKDIPWEINNISDVDAIMDSLPEILVDTTTLKVESLRVRHMAQVASRLSGSNIPGIGNVIRRSQEYLRIIQDGKLQYGNSDARYKAALSSKFESIQDGLKAMSVIIARTEVSQIPKNPERLVKGIPIGQWHTEYMTSSTAYLSKIRTGWPKMSPSDKAEMREEVAEHFGIDVAKLNKNEMMTAIRARRKLSPDDIADAYLADPGVQSRTPGIPEPSIRKAEIAPDVAPSPAAAPSPGVAAPKFGRQIVVEPPIPKMPVKGNTKSPVRITSSSRTKTGKKGTLETTNFLATRYWPVDKVVGDPPNYVNGWVIRLKALTSDMPLEDNNFFIQMDIDHPTEMLEDNIMQGVWYLRGSLGNTKAARIKLAELETAFQGAQSSKLQHLDRLGTFNEVYKGNDPYITLTMPDRGQTGSHTNYGRWQPSSGGGPPKPSWQEPPPYAPLGSDDPNLLPVPREPSLPVQQVNEPTAAEIVESNNMWRSRHQDKKREPLSIRRFAGTEQFKWRIPNTPRDWWRDVQKMFTDVYADANMTERDYGTWWLKKFNASLPADRRPGMNAALHRGSPVAAHARTMDVLNRVEEALGPGPTKFGQFDGTISVDDLNDYMDAMHMLEVYKMHPGRQNASLGLTSKNFDIQLRRLGKYSRTGERGFTGTQGAFFPGIANKQAMYARLEDAGAIISREYNQMLNERVLEGLVKPEIALKLYEEYPFYHPLRYIESPSFQATWNPSMGSKIVGSTTNDLYYLAEIGDVYLKHIPSTGENVLLPKPAEDVIGMLGKTILHHELSITLNRTARAYIRAMEELPSFGPGLKFERKGVILEYLADGYYPSPTGTIDQATGRNVLESASGSQQEVGVFATIDKDPLDPRWEATGAHVTGTATKRRARRMYATGTADPAKSVTMLPVADPNHIYMQFWEHGEPLIYQVPNEAGVLMAHLSRFDRSTIRRVTDFLQNPARWGITAYNPAFMAMQWMIETMNLQVVHGITPWASLKGLIQTALDIGGNNPEYKDMIRHRGLSLGVTGKGISKTTEDLMKGRISIRNQSDWSNAMGSASKLMTGPLSFLGHTAEVFEKAPRLTAYKAYLKRYKKEAYDRAYNEASEAQFRATTPPLYRTGDARGYRKGMSPTETYLERKADTAVFEQLDGIKARAAYEARTALVDYQRWGHAIHLADSVFLYLNAGVQGALAPLRYALRQPVSKTGKFYQRNPYQTRLAAGLGMLMGMNEAVFVWNHNVSNECNNYYDIPASDRIGGMVIMLPGCGKYDKKYGKYMPNYIKLWPARELALFTGPQTYMMEAMFDSPHGVDFMQMISGISSDVNPFQSIIPMESRGGSMGIPGIPMPLHGVGLATDIIKNRDSYFDREIISKTMQELETKDQYTSRTSSLARRVGGALGISPMYIDHGLNWGAYTDAFAGVDWFLESLDPTTPHPHILRLAHELNELENSFAAQGDSLNINGPEQNIRQASQAFLMEVGTQMDGSYFSDGVTRGAGTVRDQIRTEADKLRQGNRKPWDSTVDRFHRNLAYGTKEQVQRTGEVEYGVKPDQQTKANAKITGYMDAQANNQWMQDQQLKNWINMAPGKHDTTFTPQEWKNAQLQDSIVLSTNIVAIAAEFPMSSYSVLAGKPESLDYAMLMGSVRNNWEDDTSRGRLLFLEWRTAFERTGKVKGEGERISGEFDVADTAISKQNLRPVYAAQDKYEEELSQADRELLDYARQLHMTEMQKRWFNDRAIMKKYWRTGWDLLDTMDKKSEDYAVWNDYLTASDSRRGALMNHHRDLIETQRDQVILSRSVQRKDNAVLRHTLAFWGYLKPTDMKTEDIERFDFWTENELRQPSTEREMPSMQDYPYVSPGEQKLKTDVSPSIESPSPIESRSPVELPIR